jgi:hypothetical protein
MLIQQVVRTTCAPLVESALGFSTTESRAIGVGLSRSVVTRCALLKSIEINQVSQDRPHATDRQRATLAVRVA